MLDLLSRIATITIYFLYLKKVWMSYDVYSFFCFHFFYDLTFPLFIISLLLREKLKETVRFIA